MKITHKIRKRRNTIQRRKTLSTVQKMNSHVTAEDVYERLHVEMPEISLSTVYRNLKSTWVMAWCSKRSRPSRTTTWFVLTVKRSSHSIMPMSNPSSTRLKIKAFNW
jgi:hypothetical protein